MSIFLVLLRTQLNPNVFTINADTNRWCSSFFAGSLTWLIIRLLKSYSRKLHHKLLFGLGSCDFFAKSTLILLYFRSFEELALLPNGTVNQAYRPLAISMYSLHVQRWLEVFPREQLLIVNGDQLIYDPLSQVKRIESFLGRYLSPHEYVILSGVVQSKKSNGNIWKRLTVDLIVKKT